MADAKHLKAGDTVTWKTSQGETQGEVVKKLTRTARVKGHVAKATKDEPQFKVESETSGDVAIHKPEALTKT